MANLNVERAPFTIEDDHIAPFALGVEDSRILELAKIERPYAQYFTLRRRWGLGFSELEIALNHPSLGGISRKKSKIGITRRSEEPIYLESDSMDAADEITDMDPDSGIYSSIDLRFNPEEAQTIYIGEAVAVHYIGKKGIGRERKFGVWIESVEPFNPPVELFPGSDHQRWLNNLHP